MRDISAEQIMHCPSPAMESPKGLTVARVHVECAKADSSLWENYKTASRSHFSHNVGVLSSSFSIRRNFAQDHGFSYPD